MKFRIFFLTLLCLLGASLVSANAQVHDLDPSHSGDECAFCQTGQLGIDDGLEPAPLLNTPVYYGWRSRLFGHAEAPAQPTSFTFHARGPPGAAS